MLRRNEISSRSFLFFLERFERFFSRRDGKDFYIGGAFGIYMISRDWEI